VTTTSRIAGMGESTNSNQLMLLPLASPAKTFQWPASEQDWQELEAAFSGKLSGSWESFARIGSFLRTCQVFSLPMKVETLPSSFESWGNSGSFNPSLGLCSTAVISEWRSGAVECSLSAVLESEVPSRFFLSPRAAKGILRRAEKRGRMLPTRL